MKCAGNIGENYMLLFFRAMHNFTKCVMDTLTRKTGVRCSSEQVMGVVKLLGPRLKAELGLRFNPEECEYLSFGS